MVEVVNGVTIVPQDNQSTMMEVRDVFNPKSLDPLLWNNNLKPGVILEKMAVSDPSCIYTVKLYGVESLPSSRPVELKRQLKVNIKNFSDIIEVRFTRINSIMISTKSVNTAYELLNLKRLFDIDIITSIQMETLTSRFLIYQIPTEVTIPEIVEELVENELIPISIRRFKKNDRPSTTVLITILGKKIPEELKLWFQIIHPRPFIDKPSQCMKCFKYTHRTVRCPVRTPICRRCGGLHIIEVCNMPRSCINCGCDHDPTDRSCNTYNLECKILKYKSERHVPFHIARKACISNKSSFANKANMAITPSDLKSLKEEMYNFMQKEITSIKEVIFNDMKTCFQELITQSLQDSIPKLISSAMQHHLGSIRKVSNMTQIPRTSSNSEKINELNNSLLNQSNILVASDVSNSLASNSKSLEFSGMIPNNSQIMDSKSPTSMEESESGLNESDSEFKYLSAADRVKLRRNKGKGKNRKEGRVPS